MGRTCPLRSRHWSDLVCGKTSGTSVLHRLVGGYSGMGGAGSITTEIMIRNPPMDLPGCELEGAGSAEV